MNTGSGGKLGRTHSGRYTGGQSLRASTKTGFVVSGGVTEEGGLRTCWSMSRWGRDRLIDGMNVNSSFRDCCFSGNAFNTDSSKWLVNR